VLASWLLAIHPGKIRKSTCSEYSKVPTVHVDFIFLEAFPDIHTDGVAGFLLGRA
jgi:hypothetical protein